MTFEQEREELWRIWEPDRVPELRPASGWKEPGLQAFFYAGPVWQGHSTRVFAWYGAPEGADAEHPVPALVLVHGGGATALANWVRLWNRRGYAALAMDTCGGVPSWSENPYYKECWPRHDDSGPAGWGRFPEAELPPREQWMFHAVSAVLNGHTLLRSFPEVDASQVGLTGISWGGVISCIAAGLDDRFRFVAPVYGCGSFDVPDCSLIWEGAPTSAQRRRWFELWDPAHYLPRVRVPMLWRAGTADAAFPLEALNRSVKLPRGPVCCDLSIDYPHDHTISWQSRTIPEFMRRVLAGEALPEWGRFRREGERGSISFSIPGITELRLCVTRARGSWLDRRWREERLIFDDGCWEGELPRGTRAIYFRAEDASGAHWSSPVWEMEE